MKLFDNYEISPCRRFEEPDRPGCFWFEVCDPEEADVWTLYGHSEGEGVTAIGDFACRQAAEEVYHRFTGQPFPGSYQADAHIRRMHLAGAAFAVLERAADELEIWQLGCGKEGDPDTQAILRDSRRLIAIAAGAEGQLDFVPATIGPPTAEILRALGGVLDHFWDEERRHYEESGEAGRHVYVALARLDVWLGGKRVADQHAA